MTLTIHGMQALRVPRIAVVVSVLAAGCGNPSGPGVLPESPPAPQAPAPPTPEPSPSPSAWRATEALSVEEAVYRYQFGDYRDLPAVVSTYCLARTGASELLPWTDPPAELIGRFRDHRPPVKTVAACRMERALPLGVTDVETGGPAVIFRVAPPVWASDAEVVIDGGHHVNGLHGSGKTYRVRFQGGTWVVVEARWRWVS